MRTCLITNNDYLRDAVKSVFENNFQDEKLSIANDNVVAYSIMMDNVVDLVIFDIDVSKESLYMIDRILKYNPRCKIIVVSQADDEFTRFLVAKKSIIDYITFPFSYNKLIAVLRKVFDMLALEREKELKEATAEMPIKNVFHREHSEEELALDEKISNVFISIGIAPNVSGYAYLREGVKIAIRNPLSINHITKVIYPQVAEMFESTPSKVERAMRHAIATAWNRGRIENLNNFLGIKIYSDLQRPTNGEFIALIADKLLLEGA